MVSALMGKSEPPPVIMPPPAPSEDDTAIKEAATAEAKRLRKRKGMASTIKTSMEGIVEKPNVLKETLG